MKSLETWPRDEAARVDVVFCDIDDTLTTDGRLPRAAFDAVWSLYEHGLHVVPVTGRPAGWCDFIARMWPVAGVVGENGAFYFRYDRTASKLIQRFLLDPDERQNLQVRLQRIRDRILREVPGAAVASDQPYRIHDLAIDFCEDVPRLEPRSIDRIVDIFKAEGATAKVSSIHVNGWFGSYDKLGMIRRLATEVLDLEIGGRDHDRTCYVGDSPNDEPAFRFFANSVGVANVHDLIDRIRHPPTFVTPSRGGEGFAELAERLIRARSRV